MVNVAEEISDCPKCGSGNLIMKGKGIALSRKYYRQRYWCRDCEARFSSERIPFMVEEEFKYISKPVPSQAWTAYDQAKTSEKLMLMNLLGELSGILRFEEASRVGRPRNDLYEMVFCLALKTYSKLPCRRLISDLEIAKRMELITHVPHFTSIMNYFRSSEITPVLQELIRLSSLPLKQVESDFAVDSSGFSTSSFGRWFDHKFGKESERRIYRKAHIMIGVKTNIVTSVEVTKGECGDSLLFEPLVNSTSQRFDIAEVSADRAYSARPNLELVNRIGGVPYIPFKSSTTGKAVGSMIWAKMFEYFKNHKQEFFEHYHKRSNVESTFMMIKQKFGSNLVTKSFAAQQNEILCKILCHNLAVLIQEYFEQNLQITFSTQAQKANEIKAKS